MGVTLDLATVETVMLAGVRIAAFLLVAPPFAHRAIPGTVKAMLAIGLALAVSPRLAETASADTAAFVGNLLLQVLVGGALGFLVYLVFSAVQSAGNVIDLFGGFQIAAAFDPMSMTSGAQFGRLYQFVAIVLLFVTNAYQLVLGGLVRTFDAVPIGVGIDLGVLAHAVTHGLTQMFLATLQIAGPLVVVLFLADVGLGLLTRVAPALNAFALGFPLKILMTISFGSFAFLALPRIVEGLTGTAVSTMLEGVTP